MIIAVVRVKPNGKCTIGLGQARASNGVNGSCVVWRGVVGRGVVWPRRSTRATDILGHRDKIDEGHDQAMGG